jgi:hypothetical protein
MRRIILVLMATAALVFPDATTASAVNFGTNICLTNHSGSCVDVQDDNYTLNQPLWLFTVSGANGAGFGEIDFTPGVCDGEMTHGCNGQFFPFTDHDWDLIFDGDTTAVFDVSEPGSNLCMGELGGAVKLRLFCSSSQADMWVEDGNHLINVERTNTIDAPAYLSAASTADKAALTASVLGDGWQQWTIKCAPGSC